jgi:hypothetical protein
LPVAQQISRGLPASTARWTRLVRDTGENKQALVRRPRREDNDLHPCPTDHFLGVVDHDHVAVGQETNRLLRLATCSDEVDSQMLAGNVVW